MDIPQHAKIVLLIFKVSERRKETAVQIKACSPDEVAHILPEPLDCSARFGRVLAGLLQQKGRTVNARHLKAAPSQLYGVASRPAAEIEHAAAAALGQARM